MKKYKKIVINPTKKEIRKQNTYKVMSWMLATFFLLFGSSYAMLYFPQKQMQSLSIQTEGVKVNFEKDNVIQLKNLKKMSDEEGMKNIAYQWKIRNYKTKAIKYQIFLEIENKETSIPPRFIKYSLQRNNGEWTQPKFLDEENHFTIENEKILPENSDFVEYRFKLWVSDEVGADIDGGSFQAKIIVAGFPM